MVQMNRAYFYSKGQLEYLDVRGYDCEHISNHVRVLTDKGGAEVHVTQFRNGLWFIDRSGGLPALYIKYTGMVSTVSFFERGVSIRIEDLKIDDIDKMVMKMKYGNHTSYGWYLSYGAIE